jgi:hypothetical protein
MTEVDKLAVYAFIARLTERFAMSLVIVTIAVIAMFAFWRSVQRVEFNLAQDKIGRSANIALATPLFVLLVLVGYAFVSFSHPVTVTVPERRTNQDTAASQGATGRSAIAFTGFGNLPPSASPEDAKLRLAETRGYLRTLNCIANGATPIDDRGRNAIDAAKAALIIRYWQQDWGDATEFEEWALSGRGPTPREEVLDLYMGAHDPC